MGESRHYRRYAADRGKFISEFGIHASPELSTLRAVARRPTSSPCTRPASTITTRTHPKNKHDPVLEIVTGLPEGIEQYVDFTMISQAEGLKFGVEHYRRRQPHCSGTLIWQFNDVWPGFSWSIVDYAGVPKAAYHYARRAFAPVLASFCQGALGDLQLWLSNSSAAPTVCDAEISVGPFAGAAELTETVTVQVPAGSSVLAWSLASTQYRATADRFAWVSSPSGAFAPNRHFFAEIRDVAFGPGRITTDVERISAEQAVLRISAEGFGHFVRVPTPDPGVRFSDNYLDLRDGESAEIAVRGLTGAVADDELRARRGMRGS